MTTRLYPPEDDRALEAKLCYLKLGPKRTIGKASRELGISLDRLKKWATWFHWQDMAAAWDERSEERLIEEMLEESSRKRASDRERQRIDGEFLADRGKEVIHEKDNEDIRASEAVAMVKLGHDLLSAARTDTETRDRNPTWADFIDREMDRHEGREVRDGMEYGDTEDLAGEDSVPSDGDQRLPQRTNGRRKNGGNGGPTA